MARGRAYGQVNAAGRHGQDISAVALAGGVFPSALGGTGVGTVAGGRAGLGADGVLGVAQISEDVAELASSQLEGTLAVADVGAGAGAHCVGQCGDKDESSDGVHG